LDLFIEGGRSFYNRKEPKPVSIKHSDGLLLHPKTDSVSILGRGSDISSSAEHHHHHHHVHDSTTADDDDHVNNQSSNIVACGGCCGDLDLYAEADFLSNIKQTFTNFGAGLLQMKKLYGQPGAWKTIKASLIVLVSAESGCIIAAATVDVSCISTRLLFQFHQLFWQHIYRRFDVGI
jgi:hypothetical protein